MKLRDWLILFILGLAAASIVALVEHSPGYMDAEYYYGGGVSLAQGRGFVENYIWNYLDNPVGLPHPSHTYWMPLASILSAVVPAITGVINFSASRIIFILLAGLIPVITAHLAFDLSGLKSNAYLAGILSILPGFYLPYYATTDTFVPYMVLGGCYFLLIGRIATQKSTPYVYLLLGLLAGGMHLARADGILWLVVALGFITLTFIKREKRARKYKDWLPQAGLIFLGYLIVMGPWMARNLAVSGALLPKGGFQTLFSVRYDDLFSYPPGRLTLNYWLSSGIGQILSDRLAAFWYDLKIALGVQASVFLLPLILLGGWSYRRDARILVGLITWVATLIVMAGVFPYAGQRGGFLHSGAALQPLWWALVPVGFTRFIQWGSRVRGWNPTQAKRFFTPGLVGLALLYTIVVSFQLIVGTNIGQPSWEQSWANSRKAETILLNNGLQPKDVLMVNNPPGYSTATGRWTIAIPDGEITDIVAAGRQYGARYLLLETNHVRAMQDLYTQPVSTGSLELIYKDEQIRLFRIASQ